MEKANFSFLDWIANKGMEVRLSTEFKNINPKSFTRQEIDYLQKQYGYLWNEDQTSLIAPLH